MKFTEELIRHLLMKTRDTLKISFQGTELDFSKPIKRLTFRDAVLNKTKIDIDKIKTEKEFKDELEIRHLKLEMKGVYGLGACFDALYKEYVRPEIIEPTFITDYPAEMIALAKRKENDPTKIASFQLLACGIEFLKAYNELNDPQDQSQRWLDEQKLADLGSEIASQFDADYIRALEYGMPPTAGWGMGVDRFVQLVTDSATIKDVILFPSMRKEE
jgi:lysyl-tRNA synthetase class 2